ncbi:DUF1275 family protein [Bacillus spizizenii]|nr:DUF1275 family protein [Bacillus spizizenii]MEC0880587.1 DUF1275 family protein [Bacillus spizizenii]
MTAAAYRNTLLSLLCLTAGIVDVIGYLSLGHVFTANMTGNIVLFGLAIGKSLQVTVFNSLTALIGFICGVIISTLMVGKAENTLWPSAVTKALAIILYCVGAIIVALAEPNFYDIIIWVPIVLIFGIMMTAKLKLSAEK